MTTTGRWTDIAVGHRFEPVDYSVTPEQVERFEAAVGVRHPWSHDDSPYGFPIVPPTLPCTDYTRFLAQVFPPIVGMHARHRMRLIRPIPVGAEVRVSGEVVDKFIKRDRHYLVIEYRVEDAEGDPYVVNTISTTIDAYVDGTTVTKETTRA